jgi:hypothetical protein
MNIGDILIWEATNGLLLIPVVIALVMLTRWIRRRPVFTERDWLFLRLPGREPGSDRADTGTGQFAGRHSSEARGHRAGVVPRRLGRDQLARERCA